MIARIMGEGQFDLPDDAIAGLNDLDAEVAAAVESGDEPAFEAALTALLDQVRLVGKPVADDELVGSDLVLPHADASLDDVRELLADDGLIPG